MVGTWLELADKNASIFVARNSITGDRDDFFQIARLASWQASLAWQPGGMAMRPWLTTKVWKAMLDALASKAYGNEMGRSAYRRGERRVTVTLLPELLSSMDQTDWQVERISAKHLVERGLRSLTPREATVVSMHDLDGYRQEDIGEAMGISGGRVSQIRAVALEKMHDRLAA